MGKKLTTILALAGLLTINQRAEAPILYVDYPMPIERAAFSEPFDKYVHEAEMKFLKSFYPEFPYTNEIPDIIKHAQMVGLEPELLMAIRLQENGVDSVAYGILPSGKLVENYKNDKGYSLEGKFYSYKDEKEKQLRWAARTVQYYKTQFDKNPKNKDFISYLGKIYAPVGASNDPTGLNKNWIPKVKFYYNSIKRS